MRLNQLAWLESPSQSLFPAEKVVDGILCCGAYVEGIGRALAKICSRACTVQALGHGLTAGKRAPPLTGLLKPPFKKPLRSLCNQQESGLSCFSPFVLLTSEAQIRTVVGCYLLPLPAKLCLQHMEWVFRRDLKKSGGKSPTAMWDLRTRSLPVAHSTFISRPPALPLWIRTPICPPSVSFGFRGAFISAPA